MLGIVNDAAQAYRGTIPADCWVEPYMPAEELRHEIEAGVRFWGAEKGGELVAVMGIQHAGDVSLIRHAYVRTAERRQGAGSALLGALRMQAAKPLLVGTWAAASWAIRFYEKHGFCLVTPAEKDRLLRQYWDIGERQIETSVVLADTEWFTREAKGERQASLALSHTPFAFSPAGGKE
ncbi:MAG TPA: GNAT family N-acetyltransferase [Syntrophales bacterium]|nr:GNAT family N-acetyltransferase [Syntrophales bacterium]HNZ35937.1 GNAT family N-acetyltransferase [Syntrophales bacterium]HOF74785.1 GNAT family N-acetyltransferase [Syntrophales bacterium]HOH45434.1 GNAT family N-acetyltransferase [Syntrophales bacterium]HOR33127.1 GNAT family N-acetyltransferase [Syntrophales bacterium]